MTRILIVPKPALDLGRYLTFPADTYQVDVERDTLTLYLKGRVAVVWKWSDVHFFELLVDEDDK